MDGDSSEKMWRVRRTVLEMLSARNYVIRSDDLNMTKEQFDARFGDAPRKDDLAFTAPHAETPEKLVVVNYEDEAKVGVKALNETYARMKDFGATNGIIVVKRSLTPQAKNQLNKLNETFPLEHFTTQEMLVNITKHHLVPQHEVLSQSEKDELLKRYSVKPMQLPRIQINDPVARFYGVQRGQIMRIIRTSETAGRYVTYRLCT